MFSLISILYSVFNEHFLNLIFIKFCKHLILLKCLQNSMILSPSNQCLRAHACVLVGLSGLEPPTSCLSGMRSNHLSYNPLSWRVRFLFSGPLSWWWRWWDSNPWPPACRAGALPTELHPHIQVSSRLSFKKILQNWTTNQKTSVLNRFDLWHRVFVIVDSP